MPTSQMFRSLFPFYSFSSFSWFFFFPLAVLRFPPSYSFYLSLCVCFLYCLPRFFSLPGSSWWRILLFFLDAIPTPRDAWEPANLRISFVCFPVSCFLAFFSFISFVFLLFLLLSISIWRHFVSSSLFSCRYYDVASVSVATRLAYDTYVS